MARRRVDIPAGTARMVLARSGGYCANPSCRRDLFVALPSGHIATLDELAHIIGQSTGGPRGDDPLPPEARNDGSNIVLLCPTCHTLIDNRMATDTYSPEVLRQWKADHERRVRHGAAIPTYDDRAELNGAVSGWLRENEGIWRNVGPGGSSRDDPMGRQIPLWRHGVMNTIIPNNRRILEVIDANAHLFGDAELALVEDFRVHAGALELNHTSSDWMAGSPRYPERFGELFSN